MKKFSLIFATTVKEYAAYRLNFVLWRLRMFLSVMITFFLWNSVFDKNTSFGNYPKSYMLSYILFANLISNFVLGTRTADLAGEINDGTIINYLLKPVSIFKYYLTKDLADKIINISFAILELAVFFIIFKAPLVVPKNLLFGFLLLAGGTFIAFFINLALSFIGFWTTEVWAPRFLFMTLVFFLSGSYFPLDLLPKPVYLGLLLTPFPYLFYLPTKIILGKTDRYLIFQIIMCVVWLFLISRIVYRMWEKGIKSFSFWGR